jgi:eukaryotic-like serine/threonine-protein kinase
MAEVWKQWEGKSVEGKYPLRQYLGSSERGIVFLTEFGELEPRKAAIKLVVADSASLEQQPSNWKLASQLSHPNLLKIFDSGRCKLEGNDLLYVVTEYAEEDLSQILPQRALTPEETREMLNPVLDALEYLHGKGFVHARVKPANILAKGDQLKLSSDAVVQKGMAPVGWRKAGKYDAPEAAGGEWTTASDMWSLGVTLVEVLTQKLPNRQPGANGEPIVPSTLPAPFLEIARGCLRLEPRRRFSVGDVAERLNPSVPRARAATAAAGAPSSIDPLSVPLSPLPPRPGSSLPPPTRPIPSLQSAPVQQQPVQAPRRKSRFTVPLIVGALALAAILVVPRLTNRPEVGQLPSIKAEKPTAPPATPPAVEPESSATSKAKSPPEQKPVPAESASATPAPAPESAKPKAEESVKTASEKEKSPPSEVSNPEPDVSEEPAKANAPGLVHVRGEVLDQVLPDVSDKARATIQGRVRVTVRVHVDPSGSVAGADLDSPGPSRYFADLALQAARKWAFTPPETDGRSVASEWLLRFEFTQKDTKVTPSQTAP